MHDRRALRLAVLLFSLSWASLVNAASLQELGKVTAKAAILIDNQSGQVLFARNPHLRLPPASTTKIVTALVAVRSGALDGTVRVSRYASSMQPSKIWLRSGWTMSNRDLLYAILLNSANDASVALAEGIAGSVPEFAKQMNAAARSAGATGSHFVNPNGLPAKGHRSTAYDLAKVMQEVLRYPSLRQILDTDSTVIHPRGSSRRIRLRTRNRFLSRRDMHVIGKTGWTRAARKCFVGAASSGGREIIVAMLGSNDLWGDLDHLLDYGLTSWPGETAPQQASAGSPSEPAAMSSGAVREDQTATALAASADEADAWRPAMAEAAAPAEQGSAPEVRPVGKFRYHIRLATFAERSRAVRLRQKVAQRGYTAAVERSRTGQRTMYRVTVRSFASRASARRAARALGAAFDVDPLILANRI
jgi:D-alanyl-D-alanine carboxypeptidase (penicillin-binding protein 5/6)